MNTYSEAFELLGKSIKANDFYILVVALMTRFRRSSIILVI